MRHSTTLNNVYIAFFIGDGRKELYTLPATGVKDFAAVPAGRNAGVLLYFFFLGSGNFFFTNTGENMGYAGHLLFFFFMGSANGGGTT